MMLLRRTALVALLALACVGVAADDVKEVEIDEPVSTIYEVEGTENCFDSTPFVRFMGEAKHEALPLLVDGSFTACAWFRLPEPNEDSFAAAALFTIGDNQVWVTTNEEAESEDDGPQRLTANVDGSSSSASSARIVLFNSVDQQFATSTVAPRFAEWTQYCVVGGDKKISVYTDVDAAATDDGGDDQIGIIKTVKLCVIGEECDDEPVKTATLLASIRTRGVSEASINIAKLPQTGVDQVVRAIPDRRLLGEDEGAFDQQPFDYIDVDDARLFNGALSRDQISAGFFKSDWATEFGSGLFDFNTPLLDVENSENGKYEDSTGYFSWNLINEGSSKPMAAQSDSSKPNSARTYKVTCPKVDCSYGTEWKEDGACSATCGAGLQKFYKDTTGPKHDGTACDVELSTKTEECKIKECPIDCKPVGEWKDSGSCSALCGGGIQTETRDFTPAQYDGAACDPADLTRNTKVCNTQGCPVNCVVGSFGAYGSCSKTCGTGTQTSMRSVTTSPKNGGTACPTLSQTRDCNTQSCTPACAYQLPPTLANGGYSVSGTGKGNLGEVLTLSCNSGYLFLNVPKYTCQLGDGNTKATFVSADPAKPIQQVKCVQVTFAVPKAPTNGYFQYTIPADGSSTFTMKATCYPGYTVKLTSPSKSNVYTVNGQRTAISPTVAAQPMPTCVPSARRRLLEFLER